MTRIFRPSRSRVGRWRACCWSRCESRGPVAEGDQALLRQCRDQGLSSGPSSSASAWAKLLTANGKSTSPNSLTIPASDVVRAPTSPARLLKRGLLLHVAAELRGREFMHLQLAAAWPQAVRRTASRQADGMVGVVEVPNLIVRSWASCADARSANAAHSAAAMINTTRFRLMTGFPCWRRRSVRNLRHRAQFLGGVCEADSSRYGGIISNSMSMPIWNLHPRPRGLQQRRHLGAHHHFAHEGGRREARDVHRQRVPGFIPSGVQFTTRS